MKVKVLALGFCYILLGCHALLIKPGIVKQAEKRQSHYVATHQELSEEASSAILRGDLLIGMRAEVVVAVLGKPYDINRTTGSWGVHEQWCYLNPATERYYPGWERLKYAYVYLENGKVTSWQSD